MRRINPYIQYGLLFNMDNGGIEGASGYATTYNYNSATGSGVYSYGGSDTSGVDGRWHTYSSRYNGSTPAQIWRDGLLRATAGNPLGATTVSDASQIVMIGGLNAAGYGTIGGIGLVSAWGRPLADWEMRALHDDPMGLVRPATPKTFFIPAAAAPASNEWNILREDGGYVLREDSGQFLREDAPAAFPNQSLAFDGDTGHIRYPTTSAWTFPDADWTVGVLASITDPTGTASQYLISSGAYGGTQTFNFLAYESESTTPGKVECVIRGDGSSLVVAGSNDTSLIDSTWRLWVIERVKATETINIYHVPVNGTRTLHASLSSAGLGEVASATPTALGTRAPPVADNSRWLSGSLHSVFKIDGLLTAGEMQSIASGSSLITDLGRSPVLLTRLEDLTSPIPNLGSVSNATGTINGGIVPVAGPVFNAAPQALSVSGALAAPKPAIAATSVQVFPTRSVTGAIAALKPTISATSTQTFPARSVSGSIVATKPSIVGTAVQVFPARSVVGTIAAKKPTITATSTQTSITRSVAAAIAAKKPGIASTATQTSIARALTGAIAAPKPTVAATAVQVFPARAVTGSIAATKPAVSAATVQVFPARSLTASLSATKPTISATSTQTFPTRNLTATIQAQKPSLAAAAAQVFPARAVAGAIVASKPSVTASAAQVFPARNATGQLAATKPTAAATATQVFPTRSLTAAMDAPKPTLTAQLFQSQIGEITISSALVAKKPTITATATQVFPARSVTGSLAASKPTLGGFVTETRRVAAALSAPKPAIAATAVQAQLGSVAVMGSIAAKKPTISATAEQVFPARNVAGALAAKKPMLSASATHPLPPHEVTADLVAPKPTAAGSLTQDFPERLILGAMAAPKPSLAGGIIQVFPERFAVAALSAPKPTIRGAMVRGVSQEAPHLSNAVYMTGSVNPEVRFLGVFDLDVSFTAAVETDVFLTGTIEQ